MPLPLVACNGLRNTFQRLWLIKKIFNYNDFIFQSLVILKETFDFEEAMGRQFKH